MPSRKTAFWLLAAAILYLIAWNVGSGWLYVLVAMLAAFPVASILLVRINTRGLRFTQTAEDSATQGGSLASKYTIENLSLLPRFFLGIESGFGGGSSGLLLPHVAGRSRLEFTLTFDDLKRGAYTGSDVHISSGAPVGLASSHREYLTGCPLVVYPRYYNLSADWSAGRRDAGYMTSTATPTRRAASDYLGVRDYRPGDSPRAIHWRTTARSGHLTVVEYARQSAITPVFLLDTYGQSEAGEGSASLFETAVSIVASLVQREAFHNRRFSLGESPAASAGYGLAHDAQPAMWWLAHVEPGSETPMDLSQEDLPWPEATPVLVVSSHTCYARIDSSSFLEAFPNSVVIMLDGHAFESGWQGSPRFMNAAQLDDLGDRLESTGVRFLLIDDPYSVVPCLESL